MNYQIRVLNRAALGFSKTDSNRIISKMAEERKIRPLVRIFNTDLKGERPRGIGEDAYSWDRSRVADYRLWHYRGEEQKL